MRRDKTFARILLIFSIANVALAAPAVIRQRTLITDGPNDGSTDKSMPSLETASGVSETSAGPGSAPHEPPGSQQDWTPGSGGSPPAGSLHQDGVEPATPPPPPDGPPSPQLNDPRPGSGTPQLHDGTPAGPGAQPVDVTKNVPLRGDAPSGSGAQPLFKDAPWWQNYRGTSPEIEHEPPTYVVEDSRTWPDFGPDWGKAYTAAADAYAKEVKDMAPKGFCGLRCWKPFRRFFEQSAERNHGRRFS